jgi:hypothetical protein
MAIDPLIPNFSPSIQVPVIRRRPQADHLNGEWNLAGVTPHRGALPLGDDSLLPNERRLLAELVAGHKSNGLETAWELQAAIERANLLDAEFWLTSLMLKLEAKSVMGLVEKAQAHPELLKPPEGGEQFGPRPKGVMGRLAGV